MPRVLLFFFFTGGLSKPSAFHIRLVRPPQQIIRTHLVIIRQLIQHLDLGLPAAVLIAPVNAPVHIQVCGDLLLRLVMVLP